MRSAGIKARHLEIFLVLMTSRNLLEAADKLSISQPAVTKAIGFMENELGVTLFQRVKGRLQPTPDADKLLPFVQRAIGHLSSATQAAYGLRHDATGSISLAAGAPALTSLVPLAIKTIQRDFPNVAVRVRAESTSTVLLLVANHDVDLGISVSPLQSTDVDAVRRCQSELICEHQMVVAMSKRHPLASRPVLRPTDLRDVPIISLSEDTPNTQYARAAFRTASVNFKTSITVGNSIAVCALASEGIGVGFVHPLQLANGLFPDVIARPFRPRINLRMMLYRSAFTPLGEAASAFARCFQAAAETLKDKDLIETAT